MVKEGVDQISPGGVPIIILYCQEELAIAGDAGEGCRTGEGWEHVEALKEVSSATPRAQRHPKTEGEGRRSKTAGAQHREPRTCGTQIRREGAGGESAGS